MCIDSNKRLPLLLATAIVGMVNICNAVPAVGAPMPADSNAVSFVGISRDAEGAYAVDVGDGTYGFAGLTAETGVGIAAGVAVGLHGTDVAYAGYYTMVNGVPQDTLTSQGLQAVGVPQDWANGIDAGVSMAGTMGVGAATTAYAKNVNQVSMTPYVVTDQGIAVQSCSKEALAAARKVKGGATVYKGGVLGRSETTRSQFLSLENPLGDGYAMRYGVPPQNAKFNFVLTGEVPTGVNFITRPAVGVGNNVGGAIEVVIPANTFKINSFYMP